MLLSAKSPPRPPDEPSPAQSWTMAAGTRFRIGEYTQTTRFKPHGGRHCSASGAAGVIGRRPTFAALAQRRLNARIARVDLVAADRIEPGRHVGEIGLRVALMAEPGSASTRSTSTWEGRTRRATGESGQSRLAQGQRNGGQFSIQRTALVSGRSSMMNPSRLGIRSAVNELAFATASAGIRPLRCSK